MISITLYAPTDVQSITEPNGCGEQHSIEAGAQLIIECGPCEQAMAAHQHLGWAAKPELVAPTCDEVAQAERDEATAQKAGIARLNAYANNGGSDGSTAAALAALVAQNTALMEQVMALTSQLQAPPLAVAPTEAEFLATHPTVGITDPVVVGGESDGTLHGPDGEPVEESSAVEQPAAKRGPGRPRKPPTE